MDFLKDEFGINNIDYNDIKSLNEIRLKCFDMETEETYNRLEKGIDTVLS